MAKGIFLNIGVTSGARQVVPVGVEEGTTPQWDSGCVQCTIEVTPSILAKRYSLPAAPNGTAKGSMAVAEFQGVYWDQMGLDTFTSNCNLSAINVTQIGPNRAAICRIPLIGTELCMEAMLDIEYTKGVGGSIPLTDIFTSQYSMEGYAEKLAKHIAEMKIIRAKEEKRI